MSRTTLSESLLLLIASFAALAQSPKNTERLQYNSNEQLAVGSILVASGNLADPNFAQSVVLIVEHDEDQGSLGVIINRRTDIPMTRIFPDIKTAPLDPVFMGGPVAITAVQALLRLPAAKDQVKHVSGDLYASGSKDVIESSVRSRIAPSKFRIYVGYAGWAPGQLEAEIGLGAWSVLASRPALVFDRDPDSLWSRLTKESHMQVAKAFRRGWPMSTASMTSPFFSNSFVTVSSAGSSFLQ